MTLISYILELVYMKVKKRLLVLSNYPIKEATHGGQKRVAALVEEYKNVFEEVKFVAIFVREHYPAYARSDMYLTGRWAEKVRHNHLTSDIDIGHAMYQSPVLKQKIKRLLSSYKPDIIELNQPFAFIGLKVLLQEMNLHPKIVFNSQNAEAPMRKEIMEASGASKEAINKAIGLITETERYLAINADLTTAVSVEDQEYLKSLGAKKVVLSPNGISPLSHTVNSTRHWRNIFDKQGVKRVLLFVASAHVPNTQALKKVIGTRLGYIPPDTRLVLAGSVGPHFVNHFRTTSVLDSTFWQRAISVGILSQELLEGLIATADVMLLPIVDGGGSNLKTAEAILSGNKVVSTDFAFRGYQEYSELPNIWVAKSPTSFREAVVEALNTPLQKLTGQQKELANRAQWRYCLREAVNEVAKL